MFAGSCEISRVKFPAACCVKIENFTYWYPVACVGVVHLENMNPRKKPIIPARLYPGDVVAIAAPGSPFKKKALNQGIAALEAMGFGVRVPEGLFDEQGYLAGSDAHRAEQFNALFKDPAVKAIICARGGYGSLRILPRIDYAAVGKHPKIVVGFSDVTALLTALWVRCALVGFHGPLATTLADVTVRSRKALSAALSSGDPIEITATQNPAVLKSGKASGPLIGGNLATLCHLLATPFFPDLTGGILFIEDIGEAPYRIDRMLSQMKLAGCFRQLAGLALGSFKNCGLQKEHHRIVADVFGDLDIPILSGFEIGHGRTNRCVPIGLSATLDTRRRSLKFHEAATL